MRGGTRILPAKCLSRNRCSAGAANIVEINPLVQSLSRALSIPRSPPPVDFSAPCGLSRGPGAEVFRGMLSRGYGKERGGAGVGWGSWCPFWMAQSLERQTACRHAGLSPSFLARSEDLIPEQPGPQTPTPASFHFRPSSTPRLGGACVRSSG